MNSKLQWLSLSIATVLATVPSYADKPVTRRGTAVMHYQVRSDLQSTNDSQVAGTIRIQANEQGHSSKQMLTLKVTGLETNAPFKLIALMGDDTNVVVAGDFTANRRGHAQLSFMSKSQGRGGKNPIPEELLSLTEVRALGLENAATQTVAYAWIADASKFQYIVKRNLTPEDTNGAAAGSISLIANQNRVNFRLLAGGLAATNDYHLALNSEIRATVQADENGRLDLRSWPTDAPPILELRSLAIWDSGSNVVLRTSLPR